MSDKVKSFVPPTSKSIKSKCPPIHVTSTCRKITQTTKKEGNASSSSKNRNTIKAADHDISCIKPKGSTPKFDTVVPKFDTEYRQIAYGKFLRTMLEECLLDEKIEREETQMDIQMTRLAERFVQTADQLDKTSRRLKEINFVVEQKRLLDLKNKDCSEFYKTTEKSNATDILEKLQQTEQACLDKLQIKNVDFGYDSNSGHKQLLDAVNDAIEGLEQIKRHSNLDMEKFKEYEKSQETLKCIEKERFDLDKLKDDFETKFPLFNEKLLKEASERIAKMIEEGEDDDNEED